MLLVASDLMNTIDEPYLVYNFGGKDNISDMSWILDALIALVCTYIFLLALYLTIKKAIVAVHTDLGIAAGRAAADRESASTPPSTAEH